MVAELRSGGGTALGSLFYATPAISNLTVAVIPHKGTPHLGNPQVPLRQCFPKHLTHHLSCEALCGNRHEGNLPDPSFPFLAQDPQGA